MTIDATTGRVPAGVPAGGQFAASARSEASVTLDADGFLPEPTDEGFVKEWDPMSGVLCAVRTMNGTQVTGPIETRGNGRGSIVVQREDGPWFSIPRERIHSLKILEGTPDEAAYRATTMSRS